jgi:DNA-nicking Smr family endonuclease
MLKKSAERKINNLKHLSMYIVYKRSKANNFKIVDLHYLYLDEAEEVLFIIFEEVRHNFIQTSKKGYFEIEIITGKGIHSKNGAVLFPKISASLRQQGHQIISSKEGKIRCNVKL